jgi:hypothetical protein
MTERVMVDIESWALYPEDKPALESIAAVRFGRGWVGDELAVSVSRDSCEEHGLTVDPDTVDWQRNNRRAEVDTLRMGRALPAALDELAAFIPMRCDVWAKPAAFDLVVLAIAYRACDKAVPWAHWQRHGMYGARPLAESLPGAGWPDIEQAGEAHEALADARFQARQMAGVLDRVASDDDIPVCRVSPRMGRPRL